MSRRHQLGELQLAIMRILWERGEATSLEVHAALEERELAPTTISTMLKKMEVRELVRHRTEGRRFIYQPLIEEREVHRSMVSQLVSQLFRGDATALVDHLVSEGELQAGELDALRRRLDEARRQREDEA